MTSRRCGVTCEIIMTRGVTPQSLAATYKGRNGHGSETAEPMNMSHNGAPTEVGLGPYEHPMPGITIARAEHLYATMSASGPVDFTHYSVILHAECSLLHHLPLDLVRHYIPTYVHPPGHPGPLLFRSREHPVQPRPPEKAPLTFEATTADIVTMCLLMSFDSRIGAISFYPSAQRSLRGEYVLVSTHSIHEVSKRGPCRDLSEKEVRDYLVSVGGQAPSKGDGPTHTFPLLGLAGPDHGGEKRHMRVALSFIMACFREGTCLAPAGTPAVVMDALPPRPIHNPTFRRILARICGQRPSGAAPAAEWHSAYDSHRRRLVWV